MAGQKRKDCTLKITLEILGWLERSSKAADLVKEYGVSASTILTWKKEKAKINELADKGVLLNRKCDTQPKHPMVVECLVRWLRDL